MRQYSTNEKTAAGQRRLTVVGVDLGKTWIEVCGQDASGKVRLTGKRRPAQFKTLMAQLPACLVGLEACGRSHHWARVLQGYGHEVKLMAPQFVKPYVQSNKSDRADAQAVCEAVQRPTMRFVGVKTAAQQDQQSLHRIRSLAVAQRTALVNQVRGLLAEQGIEIGQGRARVRAALPGILEEGENGLSGEFRALVQDAYETLVRMDARLDELAARIARWAKADEQVQRLLGIPGIGPITATALLAAVGDVGTFRNGRELAAWLGRVPRQHSTGGPAAGQGMTRWTRQQTAAGNRFQALRSDMNVMATNKATLPGWEPERDTGAHDSDRRYCDKDTTARNPSGPAGIVPCNQEAGYMAAMPLLSTRTWRLQYGGEPYMSPELQIQPLTGK